MRRTGSGTGRDGLGAGVTNDVRYRCWSKLVFLVRPIGQRQGDVFESNVPKRVDGGSGKSGYAGSCDLKGRVGCKRLVGPGHPLVIAGVYRRKTDAADKRSKQLWAKHSPLAPRGFVVIRLEAMVARGPIGPFDLPWLRAERHAIHSCRPFLIKESRR